MPLGAFKDHHPAPYYRFTTFNWNENLFLSICSTLGIKYQSTNCEGWPYCTIYKFTCDAVCLMTLIQQHLTEGVPFELDNFNLTDISA